MLSPWVMGAVGAVAAIDTIVFAVVLRMLVDQALRRAQVRARGRAA